jgi:hypothetical protein
VTQAIIDITRANATTERKLVEAVLDQDSSEFKTRPIVVGFDGQRAALGGVAGMVDFRSAGTWAAEPDIARLLVGLARTTPQFTRCKIYSFHPTVLARQGDLALLDGMTDVIPLRNYIKSTASAQNSGWPEALMPLDEALRLLVQTLQESNATAEHPVPKTDIRQLLSRKDRRLLKTSSPMAAQPGLITVLLNRAAEKGLVQLIGVDPRVQVSLRGQGTAPAMAAQAAHEALVPAPLIGMADEQETTTLSAMEEEGRSKVFQTILRKSDFGIFPEVRSQFYAHISQIAKDREGIPISAREITREAAALCRTDAPPVFEGRKKGDLSKDKYPWRKLEEFGMRAMARAGMLQGKDGETAPDNPWVLPTSMIVTPLPEDLDIRLDAEMVLEIIRHCSSIGWNDRVELAGAILNGRSEALTDRVEEIIHYLLQSGRVEWDQEAEVLKVKGAPVPPPVPPVS